MKKAFTLLELVFVIVVIGILAALIIPRAESNPLREAAIQLLSDIRYTEHLAMVDDKYDRSKANWYRARWQIYFKQDNGDLVYTIYSDKDLDGVSTAPNPDAGEIAKDPTSSKDLTGDSLYSTTKIDSMNLSKKYGVVVSNMNNLMSGGCAQMQRLFFDHMGRPLLRSETSTTHQLLHTTCTITLTDANNNSISLSVEPETGYVKINN